MPDRHEPEELFARDVIKLVEDLHKNKDKPEIIENFLMEFQDTHIDELGFIKNPEDDLMDDIAKEMEHFKETGIPRCMTCKTPMINAYDRISKQISPDLWKTTCGHNKNLVLCILGDDK